MDASVEPIFWWWELGSTFLTAGSHSSSINQEDFENLLAADCLAVQLFQEHQQTIEEAEAEKLQSATDAQRKMDASNFLVPPPVAFGRKSSLVILNHFDINFRP